MSRHLLNWVHNVPSHGLPRVTAPSLDVLYKRVAPNAIVNVGGRADEVRCHPGTREKVIDRIEKWGNAQDDQIFLKLCTAFEPIVGSWSYILNSGMVGLKLSFSSIQALRS